MWRRTGLCGPSRATRKPARCSWAKTAISARIPTGTRNRRASSSRRLSVWRGLLGFVDHPHLYRTLAARKSQAEFLLKYGEDGRPGGAHQVAEWSAESLDHGKLHVEAVFAVEARVVQNGCVGHRLDHVRHVFDGSLVS